MAKADLPNLPCYEEPVAVENGSYEWRQVDAYTAPSLCYTSGAAGSRKRVLYSQRST